MEYFCLPSNLDVSLDYNGEATYQILHSRVSWIIIALVVIILFDSVEAIYSGRSRSIYIPFCECNS